MSFLTDAWKHFAGKVVSEGQLLTSQKQGMSVGERMVWLSNGDLCISIG